jgi:hypothetical protein
MEINVVATFGKQSPTIRGDCFVVASLRLAMTDYLCPSNSKAAAMDGSVSKWKVSHSA